MHNPARTAPPPMTQPLPKPMQPPTAQRAEPLRARAPKNTGAQDVAAKNAADGSTDPSTDSTNQSGLSLLQLLAKSLESDDTDTTATDAAAPAATDKTSADGTDKTSDDPNAIALAMFSQALAAALVGATITNCECSDTGDATTGITSATQSPGGAASMQDLMTVLAHDVAADAKGKSDDGATQFNVDPTKGAASDAGSGDTTALAPNALAHLGVASHFAAQHLRNDTNTADLKSPVGSSALAGRGRHAPHLDDTKRPGNRLSACFTGAPGPGGGQHLRTERRCERVVRGEPSGHPCCAGTGAAAVARDVCESGNEPRRLRRLTPSRTAIKAGQEPLRASPAYPPWARSDASSSACRPHQSRPRRPLRLKRSIAPPIIRR